MDHTPTVVGSSSSGEVDLTTGSSESGDGLPLPPPAGDSSKEKQPEEPEETPPALPPLQPGDPRWACSSDRPPAKLPIYFHDAVGRNYTFPWEKAKTWEVR